MSDLTPGPWVANYDDYGGELWFGGSGCGLWTIGPAYLGGAGQTAEGRERMAADARLIAAAPELLAALKSIVCHDAADCRRERLDEFVELTEARAAIAKATGDAK